MSKSQDFKDGSYAGLWIVLGLLFFAILGGLIWGFQVVTSDARGKGNSVIIKNDARNRIQAQEEYVRLLNEVKRADKQLDILNASRKTSAAAETRYIGAVSYCQSVTADYNALGDKYRSADFLPVGYPLVIDENDPTTDCKEN
jgi:hypothetical protein